MKVNNPNEMKLQRAKCFMDEAHRYANKCSCARKQVGCVIVKNDKVISTGYNQPPPGIDGCEDENGLTRPEVYHAEFVAICKLAASTKSVKDAIAFITYGPCLNCALLIAGTGMQAVYYGGYRKGSRHVVGIEFLKRCGIKTIELNTLSKE
ncbi:hypothetical protein LCGC14_1232590 [marine sediment metagenome]|uniref:CMP/dCMP-type deaminase domain-containing protein n=1 Tax=marine sediment metagenome TaxID=412755 RepID=A0A0F9NQC4_9ZZZZ